MIHNGPSIFSRNSKTHDSRTQKRGALLRAIESAVAIAVSMTPLSLIAFSTFSGV